MLVKNVFSVDFRYFRDSLTCWLPTYLLKCGRTWNDLKLLETTYNKQETIWNNLQWARNGQKWTTMSNKLLEKPITSKKQPETTYNEQQTTKNELQWAKNDLKNLQQARNDLKWPGTT